MADVPEADYNITESVTVQAVVGSDGESGYEASDIEKIIRISNANKEWNIERSITQGDAGNITDLIEIDGDIAIDGALNQTVGDTTKEYYKLKVKTKTTNPVIYRILVINNSNELVCEKYATISSPVEDNGAVIGYETYIAVFKDYFDENETYSVIISAASVDNTCISAWSNSIYLTKSCFGNEISDEEMILDEHILGSSPDIETLENVLNINSLYQITPVDSSDDESDNKNDESSSETADTDINHSIDQNVTVTEETLTEETFDSSTEENTADITEEISTEETTVESNENDTQDSNN
ncbi:MAG: hypothetical protein IJ167_00345 [Lachnospiraceae bacterium]|nr:hypothetical protein [Lachnospiraceae bacterium]